MVVPDQPPRRTSMLINEKGDTQRVKQSSRSGVIAFRVRDLEESLKILLIIPYNTPGVYNS